jgi:hypothetical protein
MLLFMFQLLRQIFLLLAILEFWPNGFWIAPFYGRLNPDQTYCPEVSDIPATVAPPYPRDTERHTMNKKGEDGA